MILKSGSLRCILIVSLLLRLQFGTKHVNCQYLAANSFYLDLFQVLECVMCYSVSVTIGPKGMNTKTNHCYKWLHTDDRVDQFVVFYLITAGELVRARQFYFLV